MSISAPPARRPPDASRPVLRRLWWNSEGRARAVWLVLLPVLGAYTALLATEVLATAAGLPIPVGFAVWSAAAAGATVMLALLSRRWGGRPLAEYGLVLDRRWLRDVTAGLVIGLAAATLPIIVSLAVGWIRIDAVLDRGDLPLLAGFGSALLGILAVGFWEELAMRGVFLRNTADGLRRRLGDRSAPLAALILSGVVFGLAHLGQPGHPAFVLTWVLAGLVLGGVYLASGSLALPIGIHVAVNTVYQVLFVRSDAVGGEHFSAVTRIAVDSSLAYLQLGGLLELAMWITLALLTAAWLVRRPR